MPEVQPVCTLATAVFRFTVQDGVLWLLQTRDAKRMPWAALRIAVEQVRAGELAAAAARRRLAGIDLACIEQRRVALDAANELLAGALPASIGVATGSIALDAETAQAYAAAAGRRFSCARTPARPTSSASPPRKVR